MRITKKVIEEQLKRTNEYAEKKGFRLILSNPQERMYIMTTDVQTEKVKDILVNGLQTPREVYLTLLGIYIGLKN